MARFVAERLGWLALVLLGMSALAFVVSHVIPGDPARAAAGLEAGPAQVEALRHAYGLDRPLPVQYADYLRRLSEGDLGTSIVSRRPVRDDLVTYFPATVELAIAAMLLATVVGLPLGVVAATHRGSRLDDLMRIGSLVGAAAPIFWSGLMLQLIFYRVLGWLPAGGRTEGVFGPPATTGLYTIDALLHHDFGMFFDAVRHLLLPAVALALLPLALLTRMVRASMIEVLGEDHVRTARSKGLPETVVLTKHAFRNALIPVVTLFGLQLGQLLGGAVLTETIFAWPGIGFYAVHAVTSLDFPAIMGVALLMAAMFVLMNMAVDIVYASLDPRVRY
jgi:peptide/nickel transport system permease protein